MIKFSKFVVLNYCLYNFIINSGCKSSKFYKLLLKILLWNSVKLLQPYV